MKPNKPYKLLSANIVDKEKGIVNNTFTRFIGPGDSLFSLFIRSLGYREDDLTNKNFTYVIYDKEQLNIEMFKHLLKWDGVIEDDGNFDSFNNHYDQGKTILGMKGTMFPRNSTLGKLARFGFVDFKKAWDIFRNSNFTFVTIDIIKENQRFLQLLDNLPVLKKKTSQFVKLDFCNDGTEQYKDSINNVLHNLWLKNIKQYSSVIEILDSDNQSIEDFAGKLYAKLNPSFCILPWMHIQYKPTGQSKLCCRYDISHEYNEAVKDPNSVDPLLKLSPTKLKQSISTTSMEESFFGDYWNGSRQHTIDNTALVGCYKCYKEESGTTGEIQNSMRLGSSILYNNGYLHKRPNYEKPKLEFLEVGFGNYCNLACLSCNSSLSTTWNADEIALNNIVDKKIKRTIFPKLENLKFIPDKETLKTLRVIKFTGGEPMINPEFIKFIDLICEDGNPSQISLEIYTNCSYIPSPKLLENLTKFEAVQLNLSIDAYGDVNDYVRYGSIWNSSAKQTVSNAIDHWLSFGKDNENISIIMSTTLSVLNILEIPKLMSWWMDKFKNSGNKIVVYITNLLATEYDGFFKLQPAHDPSYINLNILPKEYYLEILEWIEKYKEEFVTKYSDLEGIPECIGASLLKLEQLINKTHGNVEGAEQFVNYLESMDKIRNNSCERSIPEIVGKVKKYLQAQGKLQ
jgi:organic radical activating enzyme